MLDMRSAECEEEGMLAGPAPDVENRSPDLPSPCQLDELLLRPADVPRWGTAAVSGIEEGHKRGMVSPGYKRQAVAASPGTRLHRPYNPGIRL